MEYYRVENGSLIKAPENNIKIFIANPTDEQYRFLGYTDKIIEEEMPEAESGVIYEAYYEQIGDTIYKKYRRIEYDETGVNEVI